MKKFVFILIIIILLVSSAYLYVKYTSKEKENNNDNTEEVIPTNKTDGEKFKEEYESVNNEGITLNISSDNNVKIKTANEILDIIENKTGIVYFGFPTCPWCRNIVPSLLEVAKENNMDIYYLNIRNIGTEEEEFNKIKTILNQYFMEDENGEKRLYVPDVYFVKEGEIIGHNLGTVETQIDPYTPLTSDQILELKQIYIDLVKELKGE